MVKSKSPLSVLLVIDSLGSGGAQRQMVWLAIGLAKRGHKVSLFIYYPTIDHFRPEIEGHAVEVLESHKRSRLDPAPCLALRRILVNREFDSVISFLNTPNVYTIFAAAGIRKTKIIVSERKMYKDGRMPVGVWLRYQCYRSAHSVTANSYHQRDRILRDFPWLHDKLRVIWNGVDLDRFRPISHGTENTDRRVRLLAVATIVDWKNAYNLIKALHLARSTGIDMRIDWAGRVLDQDSSRAEYARCCKLISDLELDKYWSWLGVCKDLHSIYPTYDALVHPSFIEGLPNVICEAFASGLPVLAGAVCDHPMLIKDGENGWLFDPEDPASICDTLLKFSRQTTSERLAMGKRARAYADRELSVDKMISGYEDLLFELVP